MAALPLVACATPAERQLQKVSVASERLWAQYDACMTRVERTAVYQRLDRSYILKRDDPRSIQKMAIDRLANDQEKADLLENKRNTSRCNQDLFKGFAEINPGFNVLLARFMSEDDELVLQTVQDDITVGARNLIVRQRFAQRLRDWNFAGERIVRLYTWRLRRTCSLYCSSFSAASLLPTSTEGISNLAAATPPPPVDGQEAGLQQFRTAAEPPMQESATAAAPAAQEPTVAAAPAAQQAETAAQAAPPEPVTAAAPAAPAALEAETAGQAAPPEPVTAAAPAAQEAETTAEPQTQAAATAANPAAQEPTVATAPAAPAASEAETTAPPAPPKPVTAAAPAAQEAETIEQSPPQQAETKATPAVQETETAAPSPAQKSAVVAAPTAKETETIAEPSVQTTGPAPNPPLKEVDTGLKPAAGPADEPDDKPADEPAKAREQQVAAASTVKTAQPRYTVHLASMRSEVEARAEWGQLQARYPAILGDRVLFTREVEIAGRGTFVRVLTGLFHDRGQAKDFCGQLGGGVQYCAILRL
jgi:hypothetical protein